MRKKLIILFIAIMGLGSINNANAQDWNAIRNSVNKKFIRWSSDWFIDTYVVGSVNITEVESSGSGYEFWGTFKFTRGGKTYEITCSGKVSGDYRVMKLCYKDSSLGMSDCY